MKDVHGPVNVLRVILSVHAWKLDHFIVSRDTEYVVAVVMPSLNLAGFMPEL